MSNLHRIKIIFLSAWLLFLKVPGYSQEAPLQKDGFWIHMLGSGQEDTLNLTQSLHFVSLAQIKSLPICSVPLTDHKTQAIITWEGASLREVIRRIVAVDWDRIDRMIIKAPDGYSSVISGLRMRQAESALCAFSISGKNWPAKFGSMRVIFPELHEMHWVNNPSEIQLMVTKQSETALTWRFLFFDSTAFQSLRDAVAEQLSGWTVNPVLTAMGASAKEFGIFTFDGHIREYLFDDIAQRMRLAPDSAGTWKIRGEGVPIGFRLRKIFFLFAGNVGLFTRSLSVEEQSLWQDLFAELHPLLNRGIPAREISLVLASGQKIPASNFRLYQAGEISLYQLLQRERDSRPDGVAMDVTWEKPQ